MQGLTNADGSVKTECGIHTVTEEVAGNASCSETDVCARLYEAGMCWQCLSAASVLNGRCTAVHLRLLCCLRARSFSATPDKRSCLCAAA